jgi:hypothetical protein
MWGPCREIEVFLSLSHFGTMTRLSDCFGGVIFEHSKSAEASRIMDVLLKIYYVRLSMKSSGEDDVLPIEPITDRVEETNTESPVKISATGREPERYP